MACAVSPLFYHEPRAETLEELFAALIKIVPKVYHEPFQVTAVTLTGRIIPIQVHSNNTILQVKQEIYKQDQLPLDQQRLVFNGSTLENDKFVYEYGIKSDSRLYLILRLRGGMFHESSSRNDFLTLSYKSKELLERGLSMIRHMRNHYDNTDIIDNIRAKWMECKEEEIPSMFNVIERYYVN